MSGMAMPAGRSGYGGGKSGGARKRARSGVAGLDVPRDILRVVLASLIFLAVGRAHQHFGFLSTVRPALLLFGAGMAYAVLKPGSVRWEQAFSNWPTRVVVGLGILACVSVPFALSIGTAGSFMLNAYAKVLLTFFLLVAALRRPRDLYLFVWAYVLGCAFLVYVSLFTFSLQWSGGMSRLGNLYFYDANDLGVVLTAGIPLCLVLLQNSGKRGKLVAGLILLGIGASLARSGSRGGFLGLLAVGIVLLFLLRNVSVLKRAGAVLAVALGLFVMAPEGYWTQMETLTQPTDDYNWTDPYGRKAVAKRGMGYMLANPLVGVGVGNFSRAEGLIAEESQARAQQALPFRWTAAHNAYVQAGAELGIPGLLLFCSLVFGSMFGMIRLRKRLPRRWRRLGGEHRFLYDLATYLPVSLVGFAVSAFFVSFAYHDILYVLTVFVAGTYLFAGRLAREEWAARHSWRLGSTARGAVPARGS